MAPGSETVTGVGRPGVTSSRTGATSGFVNVTEPPVTRHTDANSVTSGWSDVTVKRMTGDPTTVVASAIGCVSSAVDCPGSAAIWYVERLIPSAASPGTAMSEAGWPPGGCTSAPPVVVSGSSRVTSRAPDRPGYAVSVVSVVGWPLRVAGIP